MAVQAFEQGGNAYNLVAKLIVRLKELNLEMFSDPVRRQCVGENENWVQAVEELVSKYPQLVDQRRLCGFGIDPTLFDIIQKWEHYGEFFYVLTLLQRIDRAMKWEAITNSFYVVKRSQTGFSALNENTVETGVYLFPRVPSLILDGEDPVSPKQWSTRFNHGINQELSNMHYLMSEDLVINNLKYVVCHHFVRGFSMEGRRSLRIVASPCLCDAKLSIHKEFQHGEGENLFSVQGIENMDQVLRRLQTNFIAACQVGKADILCFPEMLGSAQLFPPGQDYSEKISDWIKEAEMRGNPAPYLTVGPTWWHENRNELPVLSSTGEYLLTQSKQYPYPFLSDEKNGSHKNRAYLEDLRNIDRTVHVLHIPGLGRVAFPICIDFLQREYMELLVKKLYCNMLICPSYTPGKTQFALDGPAYRPYGCFVLWINSCSAPMEAGKGTPDYVGTAIPIQENGAFQTKYLRVPQGCHCGEDNEYCLFLIDIDLLSGEIQVHDMLRGLLAS